ncbi:uncharacterized protein [Periplaneta americana]|uniref:uncharacterized protein n=1 Tax=Periplaneta americana TaxID=6978 RepID=UPI0037E7D780
MDDLLVQDILCEPATLFTFIKKLKKKGKISSLDKLWRAPGPRKNRGIVLGKIMSPCIVVDNGHHLRASILMKEVFSNGIVGKDYGIHCFGEFIKPLVAVGLQIGDYVGVRAASIEENPRRDFLRKDFHFLEVLLDFSSNKQSRIFCISKIKKAVSSIETAPQVLCRSLLSKSSDDSTVQPELPSHSAKVEVTPYVGNLPGDTDVGRHISPHSTTTTAVTGSTVTTIPAASVVMTDATATDSTASIGAVATTATAAAGIATVAITTTAGTATDSATVATTTTVAIATNSATVVAATTSNLSANSVFDLRSTGQVCKKEPVEVLLKNLKKEGSYILHCKVCGVNILSPHMLILTVTDGTPICYTPYSYSEKYQTLTVKIFIVNPNNEMLKLKVGKFIKLTNVCVQVNVVPGDNIMCHPIFTFRLGTNSGSVEILRNTEPKVRELKKRLLMGYKNCLKQLYKTAEVYSTSPKKWPGLELGRKMDVLENETDLSDEENSVILSDTESMIDSSTCMGSQQEKRKIEHPQVSASRATECFSSITSRATKVQHLMRIALESRSRSIDKIEDMDCSIEANISSVKYGNCDNSLDLLTTNARYDNKSGSEEIKHVFRSKGTFPTSSRLHENSTEFPVLSLSQHSECDQDCTVTDEVHSLMECLPLIDSSGEKPKITRNRDQSKQSCSLSRNIVTEICLAGEKLITANIFAVKNSRLKMPCIYKLKARVTHMDPDINDDLTATNIITSFCPLCGIPAAYSSLVTTLEAGQLLCMSCFKKGTQVVVVLSFLFYLHLEDESNDKLIATVCSENAVEFLGCTVWSFLRDPETRRKVRQTLVDLTKANDQLLMFGIESLCTDSGVNYVVKRTILRSQ